MSLAPIDSQKQVPLRHQLRRDPARVRRRRLDAGRRQRLRALKYPNTAPTPSPRSSGTSRAPTTTTSTRSGPTTTARPTRAPARAPTSPAARTSRTRSGSVPADQRKVGARADGRLPARLPRHGEAVRADDDRRRPPPASICPTLRGVACRELVKTSYVAPAAQRQDVIRPEAVRTRWTIDAAGGELTATGFATYDCVQRGPRPDHRRADQGVPAQPVAQLDGVDQPLLRAPADARLGRPGRAARRARPAARATRRGSAR